MKYYSSFDCFQAVEKSKYHSQLTDCIKTGSRLDLAHGLYFSLLV